MYHAWSAGVAHALACLLRPQQQLHAIVARCAPILNTYATADTPSYQELLGQSSHYAEKTRKHALEGIKDLFTRHPEELRAHVGTFYTKSVLVLPANISEFSRQRLHVFDAQHAYEWYAAQHATLTDAASQAALVHVSCLSCLTITNDPATSSCTFLCTCSVVPRIADTDASVRTALQGLLRDTVVPVLDGAVLQPFMPVIMAHVCAAMTHLSLDVRNDALLFLDILVRRSRDH